jgi:hypothetical protein
LTDRAGALIERGSRRGPRRRRLAGRDDEACFGPVLWEALEIARRQVLLSGTRVLCGALSR